MARQAINEDGHSKYSGKKKVKSVASWARWDLKRRCQDISCEIRNAEQKKDEIFQSAIEGKLRVQDRASERLQDHIMEEIKELESTKTEAALQRAGK